MQGCLNIPAAFSVPQHLFQSLTLAESVSASVRSKGCMFSQNNSRTYKQQCCFRSWCGRLSSRYTLDSGMAVQGHSKHLFSLSQSWYNQICSPALWQTCSWVTDTLMQNSRFNRQTQAKKAAADCGQRSTDWCSTLPALSTPFPPLHSSKCTAAYWCH